jgi:hypothetical protein
MKENDGGFGLMVFWALPKQISILKRENLIENWQTGRRNSFFGKVLHNLDYYSTAIRCREQ